MRADVSPLAGSAARRGADRARPADRQAVEPAGGGGRDPAYAGALSRALRRVHGQALPRTAGEAARLPARLYGDEAAPAPVGTDQAGAATICAPQEAAAPAAAGHAAAPGRLAASLAGRRAAARSGGHSRRRHLRGLLGVPGRRRGHPPQASAAWPRWWQQRVYSALSTPTGEPLLPHAQGWRQGCRGRSSPRSAGRWPGSASNIAAYSPEARDRCERRLPHPAGPAAEGTQARRHHQHPGGQPLAGRGQSARAQCPLRGAGGARGAPPLSPTGPALGARFSASRKSVWPATTIPPKGSGFPCRSRRRRYARTSCAPRCGFTNTRMSGWRSTGGRTGSPIAMPVAGRSTPMRWPPEPLRPPEKAVGCGYRSALPTTHHNPNRTRQIMRYKNRST